MRIPPDAIDDVNAHVTDLAGSYRQDSHNAHLKPSIHSQIVSNSDQSEPDPRGIL
jgi:hypothetical protein